jgi:arylsulfatase A-like enzyme
LWATTAGFWASTASQAKSCLAIPDRTQGTSLVPLLQAAPTAWRTSFLYEAKTSSLGSWPVLAVRTDRWKYIQTFDSNAPGRLAFEELYDLRSDPREAANLAGEAGHENRVAALRRELGQLQAAIAT